MSNHTNNKNRNLSSSPYQAPCPNCGFERNDLKSIICENCERPLTAECVHSQGGERITKKKLKVIKTKTISQVRGKNQKTSGQRLFLFSTVGVVVLASSVFLASTLNASPEAKLRKAEDVIYYDGEPCSRFMMGEEVAQVLKKINKKLILVNDKFGSNKQIDRVSKGELDLAFSEKAFMPQHYERAKQRGVEIVGIPYGRDGVAFFTNKKNKIRPLTVEEIKGLIEGRIINWKDLGGKDQTIIPVLMAGDTVNPMGFVPKKLSPNTKLIYDERKLMKKFVESNEAAFSYTSATLIVDELDKFNVASIKKEDGTIVSPVIGKGVTNQKAIRTGEYPLRRQVMIVVNKEIFNRDPLTPNYKHNQTVRAFVEFLLSKKGQRIVEEADFVAKRAVASDSGKFFFLPWF